MPRLVTGWIFPELITEVSDGRHTKSVENDLRMLSLLESHVYAKSVNR